jgi:ASC-1-like (ASCH) protein
MKKTLGNLIIIVYIIIAISVTFCLLNYNDYNVTEIGGNTLILITDDSLEPEYLDGDLVIAKNGKTNKIKEGDKIFFYNDKNIKLGEVKQINRYEGISSTFILDGNYQVIEEDVIGSTEEAKAYNKVGKVLSILESKWGFLFLIIFPSVLAFLYEIFQMMVEIKDKD